MAELAQPIDARDPALLAARRVTSWRPTAVRTWPAVRQFILVLFVLYLAKQAIFVLAFHPFSGHDEVAHFAYLRTVAEDGRVPVLLEDRLPDDLFPYCRYTLDWSWNCLSENPVTRSRVVRQDTTGRPMGLQYAANHPPLYYILMTPLYWVSDGASIVTQQYLLRIAAIPFGLATVWLAYRLARTLFPDDAFLAVTVPTFVAFQPQISYEAAMVNNDIVCIALYSWILYLLVVGLRDRFPARLCVLLGFALGLALLAKGTSLTATGVIGLGIILGVGWRNVRDWVWRGALVVGPAAILTAPWYIYLLRTYDNLDGLDQVEQIQYWNRPEGGFFDLLFNREFVVQRFSDTWGEFGWRLLPLDTTLLWGIALPLILAFGGLVQYALTANRVPIEAEADPVLRPVRWQWLGLVVLAATCAVAYLAVVQFGTRFELTQSRYFFPAVNAAALLTMLGLRTLIPRRYHPHGQAAVFGALVLLNVLIFSQYVIPHYLNPQLR